MQSNLFPQIEKNSRKTVIYQTNNRVKITRFNAGLAWPGLVWLPLRSERVKAALVGAGRQ